MVDGGDSEFIRAVACASLILAGGLVRDRSRADSEKVDSRAEKMRRVIALKRSAWAEMVEGSDPSPSLLADLVSGWPEDQRRSLLVELAFSDPFAPYSLSYRRSRLLRGLRKLAPSLSLDPGLVESIEETRHEAVKSHRKLTARKMTVVGLAAAVAVGSAGWLAAPAIGTALGASAGLSGAAATSYGLALLGGGSLAAGGAGMAGGMWLVAGTAAGIGMVGGSGSALLLEMGAAQTRDELVKLQVTFRIAVLGVQSQTAKAQEVITRLKQREDELTAVLEEERQLNDENARRVKELAAKVHDLVTTREWMERLESEPVDVR